jgi:hypothetical protein
MTFFKVLLIQVRVPDQLKRSLYLTIFLYLVMYPPKIFIILQAVKTQEFLNFQTIIIRPISLIFHKSLHHYLNLINFTIQHRYLFHLPVIFSSSSSLLLTFSPFYFFNPTKFKVINFHVSF